MEIKEEWKDIENYEGLYQISNLGRVKSLNYNKTKKEKILKPGKNNKGYLQVSLFRNKKGNRKFVHRLVAKAFIENPENLPIINHKDENPSNNNVNNLEWCTVQYNNIYGTRTKRQKEKISKPVLQFTKDGEFVKRWNCVRDIQRELGFNNGHISECCSGKLKTTNGYKWCYLKTYIDNFLADWLVDYQNEVAV